MRTAVVLAAMFAVACGSSPRITLPTGPGTPAPDDAGRVFQAATAACRGVHSLTLELALSGTTRGQRIRGRVLGGFAPGAVRLEGLAPFGPPVFILAAADGKATLFLSRDRRVLQGAPPAEVLDALVGVSLSPDDLLATFSGCVSATASIISARAYGPDWIVVDLAGGDSVYLNRVNGEWRVAAGILHGLTVEYGRSLRGMPETVRIRTTSAGLRPDVDVTARLASFEVNAALGREAFSVVIPPGTEPISLEELGRSGPLSR